MIDPARELLCVICGRDEPCMPLEDTSPCTFDPTYEQAIRSYQRAQADLNVHRNERLFESKLVKFVRWLSRLWGHRDMVADKERRDYLKTLHGDARMAAMTGGNA